MQVNVTKPVKLQRNVKGTDDSQKRAIIGINGVTFSKEENPSPRNSERQFHKVRTLMNKT